MPRSLKLSLACFILLIVGVPQLLAQEQAPPPAANQVEEVETFPQSLEEQLRQRLRELPVEIIRRQPTAAELAPPPAEGVPEEDPTIPFPTEAYERLFALGDTNGDGRIAGGELDPFLQQFPQMLRDRLRDKVRGIPDRALRFIHLQEAVSEVREEGERRRADQVARWRQAQQMLEQMRAEPQPPPGQNPPLQNPPAQVPPGQDNGLSRRASPVSPPSALLPGQSTAELLRVELLLVSRTSGQQPAESLIDQLHRSLPNFHPDETNLGAFMRQQLPDAEAEISSVTLYAVEGETAQFASADLPGQPDSTAIQATVVGQRLDDEAVRLQYEIDKFFTARASPAGQTAPPPRTTARATLRLYLDQPQVSGGLARQTGPADARQVVEEAVVVLVRDAL